MTDTSSLGTLTIESGIAWNGKLAFVAMDASGGLNVYVTDGAAAGTVKLGGPYWPNSWIGDQKVGDLTAINATTLYFRVGLAPYISFGAAGDAVAMAPAQFTNPDQGADFPTLYNGQLYFDEYTPTYGTGIYSTDGANVYYEGSGIAQGQPVILNGKLIFPGEVQNASGFYVSGLYSSDGTATGTVLLNSVAISGTPVLSGSQVYFFSQGPGTNDWDLWVSDGTSAGTKMVAATAHNAGSAPAPVLTAVSGGVMFTADDGTHGAQPWFSNGTAAGTYMLDLNTQADPSASIIATTAANANGQALFMTANTGASTSSIWISDGTTAGTHVIGTWDAQAISNEGVNSWSTGNETFFQAFQGSLWVTDGTSAGTKNLGSIGNAYQMAAVDGKLYIDAGTALQAADANGISTVFNHSIDAFASAGDNIFVDSASGDGVHGAGTYAYNALSGTTTFLTGAAIDTSAAPDTTATIGSKLLFMTTARDLMVSDGTAAGTIDLSQSPDWALQAAGGLVYFTESNSTLWVTDGTVAGTRKLLTDNNLIRNFAVAGGVVYYESLATSVSGDYVYYYNTSTSATGLVGSIDSFTAPTVAGDVAYITTANGLYRLDPTGETQICAASEFRGLTPVGSKLFFEAGTGSQWGLYVTDGTAAGTIRLAGLPNLDSVSLSPPTVVGDRIYFQNTDPVNGLELWVSDGTVAGTHRVTNTTTAGPGTANASDYVSVGSTTFFTATDGLHGQELWKFTGAQSSAAMVVDLNTGAADSNPSQLTAFGGGLYFVATGADGIAELWRTTGSGATQITTPTSGGTVQDLTVVGDRLFFYGSDTVHGSGLFVTDGTSGGVTFLQGLSQASAFIPVGGELYFNGSDAAGPQLWKSDGTVAGTQRVTGAFKLATSFDLDGDGKSDLLWRNSATGAVGIWASSQGGAASSYETLGVMDPAWQIAGSGDFDGDGKADILWRNTSTGDVGAWESSKGGASTFADFGTVGLDWTIAGVGDFDGDGKSDILWRNTTTGEITEWRSSRGVGPASFVDLGVASLDWTIAGVGDFDGDGKSDLLWRNTTTGEVTEWLSSKGGGSNYVDLGDVGLDWTIAGVGDFDGDGKSDILWRNTNSGQVTAWESSRGGGPASFVVLGSVTSDWALAGVGDYDGDGKSDLIWRNTNSGQVTAWDSSRGGGGSGYVVLGTAGPDGRAPPLHLPAVDTSDLDGDGKSDVVWRNAATGEVGMWASSRGSGPASYEALGHVDLAWQIAGAGDFDGDGVADVLWRNTATGDVGVWASSLGEGPSSFVDFGSVGLDWTIAGVGDFDGDGKSDLLWRNASTGEVTEWLSSRGGRASSFADLGVVGLDWTIAGVGDFDGDGKSDLVWRNTTTGEVTQWLSSKGGGSNYVDFGGVGLDWTLAGVGDFDGDGKSDILWRNTTTGQVTAWESSRGGGPASFVVLGSVTSDWALAGVGDYDGDGKSDILWRNTNSGQVTAWESSRGGASGYVVLGTTGSPWQTHS